MWARIIINTAFFVCQILLYRFLATIEDQGDSCPCSSGWKLAQAKLFTNIMVLLNLVNIFVPLNRGLHNIPIVGGSISIIYLVMLGGELCLVYSICKELEKPVCRDCEIDGYERIVEFFQNQSMIACLGYAIVASIIQLYF